MPRKSTPKPAPRSASRYDQDFRDDAVRLCLRGDRTLVQVSRDLGVNYWTLREWYTKAQMSKRKTSRGSPLPPAEETDKDKISRLERELKKLQKENDSLRMDREILKKAAAFFAKESE
jgi:transposase